jgi:hypothetical protein
MAPAWRIVPTITLQGIKYIVQNTENIHEDEIKWSPYSNDLYDSFITAKSKGLDWFGSTTRFEPWIAS